MLRFDNWTCCLSQDKAADTLTNSRDTILLWQSMLSRTECLCGSSLCPRSQSRCICSSSILSDWHGLESLYECFWKMGTEEYILDRLLPKALPRALLDVFNRGKKIKSVNNEMCPLSTCEHPAPVSMWFLIYGSPVSHPFLSYDQLGNTWASPLQRYNNGNAYWQAKPSKVILACAELSSAYVLAC